MAGSWLGDRGNWFRVPIYSYFHVFVVARYRYVTMYMVALLGNLSIFGRINIVWAKRVSAFWLRQDTGASLPAARGWAGELTLRCRPRK